MTNFMLALLLAVQIVPIPIANSSISGQIRSVVNPVATLQGIRVVAIPVPAGTNVSSLLPVYATAITDVDGRFQFRNLQAGRYVIAAGPANSPVYYPGVVQAAAASLVNVASNAAVNNVNFSLSPPANGVSVRGAVIGYANQPMGSAKVVLSSSTGLFNAAAIESDGTFAVSGVLAGAYTAAINAPVIGATTAEFNVADQDIADVQLIVPALVRVTGQFVVEDGGPFPVLPPLEFVGSADRFSVSTRDPKGTFSLTIPRGDYRIRVGRTAALVAGLPAGYTVKSISSGADNISADPIRLVAADAESILVTLEMVSVKVTGRVAGMSNLGPRSVTVSLTPGADSGLPTITTSTTMDGAFEFPRVPPGTYSAVVVPTLPGSLRTAVNVAARDIQGVLLTIPGPVDIKGRVIVDGGGPAPRFNIAILDIDPRTSSSNPVRPDGSFSLRLAEGDHRLRVEGVPAGYELKSFTYGADDAQEKSVRYSNSSPEEFVLKFGLAADFQWRKLSGKIVGGENVLPISKHVVISSRMLSSDLEIEPKSDGTFEVPRLAAGEYLLHANVSPPLIPVDTTITIRNDDLAGVEVRIANLVTLYGNVRVEKNGPVPPSLGIRLVPAGESVPAFRGSMFTSPRFQKNADGSFALTNAEGHYRAAILNLPAGYSILSFTAGALDLSKDVLTISPSNLPVINLVLGISSVPPWGKVIGKFVGSVPVAPDPPDRNLVRPDNALRYGGQVQFMTGKERVVLLKIGTFGQNYEAPIAADGSFEFPVVFPGNYILRLVPVSPDLLPDMITVKDGDILDLRPVIQK